MPSMLSTPRAETSRRTSWITGSHWSESIRKLRTGQRLTRPAFDTMTMATKPSWEARSGTSRSASRIRMPGDTRNVGWRSPKGEPMRLEGSCHCGAVRFRVESHTPYPYMRCYCSICRKTQGGGGYAINIMGDAPTLRVRGAANLAVYRARIKEPGDRRKRLSPARRHFCKRCGSALWVADPRWPEWIYPFASAIDPPFAKPPQEERW